MSSNFINRAFRKHNKTFQSISSRFGSPNFGNNSVSGFPRRWFTDFQKNLSPSQSKLFPRVISKPLACMIDVLFFSLWCMCFCCPTEILITFSSSFLVPKYFWAQGAGKAVPKWFTTTKCISLLLLLPSTAGDDYKPPLHHSSHITQIFIIRIQASACSTKVAALAACSSCWLLCF